MVHRIYKGFCLAVLLSTMAVIAEAQQPTFSDLLARADAQMSAGHRLAPPGDNLAETIVAMMAQVSTATPAELDRLSALLKRDREAETGVQPPQPAMPKPAAEPPAIEMARPAVRPDPAAAAQAFLRGQQAEEHGDISAARRLYATAAQRGSAEAAQRLGRLYDPAYLKQAAIGGIDADPALARHWYDQASRLGKPNPEEVLQAR